jgi:hypothetical protein
MNLIVGWIYATQQMPAQPSNDEIRWTTAQALLKMI